MLAERYKFGHHVKFEILIKILQLAMSMQQNEMGVCFFLRIRGGLEEWVEIRNGQSTISRKTFL